MGWTFSCDNTKQEEIDSILNGFVEGYSVRKHSLRGNHLWMIVDTPDYAFIGLALLQSGHPDPGYGHKILDESMGPSALDCPVSWLDEVPVPPHGTYAAGWREEVRANHARQNQKKAMAPGQVWRIAGNCTHAGEPCHLVRKARRGWVGEIGDTQYTVMPRMLVERVS